MDLRSGSMRHRRVQLICNRCSHLSKAPSAAVCQLRDGRSRRLPVHVPSPSAAKSLPEHNVRRRPDREEGASYLSSFRPQLIVQLTLSLRIVRCRRDRSWSPRAAALWPSPSPPTYRAPAGSAAGAPPAGLAASRWSPSPLLGHPIRHHLPVSDHLPVDFHIDPDDFWRLGLRRRVTYQHVQLHREPLDRHRSDQQHLHHVD